MGGSWITTRPLSSRYGTSPRETPRIIAIDQHSFTLQLHNDPQTTEILYSDVDYLQTGMTAGQKVILFDGLAAVAGGAFYGFVQVHNLESKPLPTPTPPPFP